MTVDIERIIVTRRFNGNDDGPAIDQCQLAMA